MGNLLRKNMNFILIAVLLATMVVSYAANQRRPNAEVSTVSLPVVSVTTAPSALEEYRRRREETALQDMAALQALCESDKVDETTRSDAASQLQKIILRREQQSALEGALIQSGLAPCVAVITEGSVTIVTGKEQISEAESALVMTLAQTHAHVKPAGVRIIPAGNAVSR